MLLSDRLKVHNSLEFDSTEDSDSTRGGGQHAAAPGEGELHQAVGGGSSFTEKEAHNENPSIISYYTENQI